MLNQKNFYVLWKKDICIGAFNTYRELAIHVRDNLCSDVNHLVLPKVLISDDFYTLCRFYYNYNYDDVVKLEDDYRIEKRTVLVSDFYNSTTKEDLKDDYNWFATEIKTMKSKSKFDFSEVERLINV